MSHMDLDEEEQAKITLRMLNTLDKLRNEGVTCDCVLRSEDNKSYSAHRSIMATCSPYFKALFTTNLVGNGDVKLSKNGRKSVLVPGVSGDILKQIVDYAYRRHLDFDHDNVYGVMSAADQFNIVPLVEDCCRFLQQNIDVDNCVCIWAFSKQFFCPQLTDDTFRFLAKHFTAVCKSDVISELPCDMLMEVLTSDELIVDNEMTVWKCVLHWIDRDVRERHPLMPKLLPAIRLGLLPADEFINQVNTHPYVTQSPECRSDIIKAIQVKHGMGDADTHLPLGNDYMIRARFPRQLLMCIGGWMTNNRPTNLLQIYDHRVNKFVQDPHPDPDGPRAYHRSATIGHLVYVIGGTNGMECLNSCRCFDLRTKTWTEIAPMHIRRCYSVLAVLNGLVYVIGGFDGDDRHNSVERYDPLSNQWTLVSSMNEKRSDAGGCVIADSLFVFGGFNGTNYLTNGEFYNECTDQWVTLHGVKLTSPRSGVSCVAIDFRIYILGGFNGYYRLSSCEVYNTVTGQLEPMPEMLSSRSNFSTVVLDGNIYVCGGYNGQNLTSGVDKFDFRTGLWKKVSKLLMPMSALSACTIFQVSDFAPKQRAVMGSKHDSKHRRRLRSQGIRPSSSILNRKRYSLQ